MGWCGQQENRQHETETAELCRVEVVAQKATQPGQNESVVGRTCVRIRLRFRHQVVSPVIGFAGLVMETGIEPKTEPADSLIDQRMCGRQAVMHGVVGKDEQPGVQKAAKQNPACDQQGMELIRFKPQADDQCRQPGGSDQSSQLETALRFAVQTLTWHQA